MRAQVTSFAISRAGAVAAVVTGSRPQSALPLAGRLALLASGAATIGIGAGATLATGLGAGPFDVLVSGISTSSGLSFALSLWITAGLLAVVASILGHRPGPGTALAPLIVGPTVQVCSAAIRARLPLTGSGQGGVATVALDRPSEVAMATAVHLAGVLAIGIGAGALVTSGLGAGTGELVAAATSSKLGRSLPVVRTGCELSWIGLGLLLGGAAGIGTVLVAVTIGPAVRLGHLQVDAMVGRVIAGFRPDGTDSRHGTGSAPRGTPSQPTTFGSVGSLGADRQVLERTHGVDAGLLGEAEDALAHDVA